MQAFSTEMHRMKGVLAQIDKSAMTDAEKLKATDQIAGTMLATAKLGSAAMQQARTRFIEVARLGQEQWDVSG